MELSKVSISEGCHEAWLIGYVEHTRRMMIALNKSDKKPRVLKNINFYLIINANLYIWNHFLN